jgi:hypothetical protein
MLIFYCTRKVLAEKKPLHGRRLQVIVKAANYVLQPGQTHEGSWHVEGMRHERIAASGIYYYSTTPNLPDSALYFREKRANILEERTDTQGFNFHKNLGKARNHYKYEYYLLDYKYCSKGLMRRAMGVHDDRRTRRPGGVWCLRTTCSTKSRACLTRRLRWASARSCASSSSTPTKGTLRPFRFSKHKIK